MKSMTSAGLVVLTILAGPAIPIFSVAQEQNASHLEHQRYRFVDLGTFGGPLNYLANDPSGGGAASGILNARGMIVSAADTSVADPNYPNTCLVCPDDPFIFHAFRWHEGVLTDMGSLPGTNSSFANSISKNGLMTGFSENSAIDPLLGVPEIDAVLWKGGQIINLGTLEGGYESNGFAVNDRGQVAGVSLNTIADPFSPFGFQVRAFLWRDGTMTDLGTLGGPDASAYFLNGRNQIAGVAYTNSTPNAPITFPPCQSNNGLPTQDPFLWEDGTMIDLGTLGGTCGTPNALNNHGEVVGLSNLAGDLTFHPFRWSKTDGMKDLGTFGGNIGQANSINEAGEIVGFATSRGDQALFAFLWRNGVLINLGTAKGDMCSAALGINSRSQVVGLLSNACTFVAADRHASLWEKGHVTDLNQFLPSGSGLQQLTDAYNINDRGEIVGLGIPPGCGDEFACGRIFVLVPCEDADYSDESCMESDPEMSVVGMQDASPSAMPSEMRERVRSYIYRQNRRSMVLSSK